MEKFKYLTVKERYLIIKLYIQKKKMQEIAELLGKSTTSISKVINSFPMEGKVASIKR